MNLMEKRKYQEQISAYEKELDEVSKLLINNRLKAKDEEVIRNLVTKSYAIVGTFKLLLNESFVTMERES